MLSLQLQVALQGGLLVRLHWLLLHSVCTEESSRPLLPKRRCSQESQAGQIWYLDPALMQYGPEAVQYAVLLHSSCIME